MSGKSNVLHGLARHKISARDELVNRIFDAAKQSPRVLTEEELVAIATAAKTPV
jgi:hypothetical protein